QDFQGGTIVQITSGTRKNQIYAVSGPIFRRYHAIGEGSSALGYPVGVEFTVSGRQRQTFEVGYIDYVPGAPAAVEHTPVVSVSIDDAPLTLQVGNVAQRTAGVYDTRGAPATDVPITWTTSNRAVVQIDANGATATLRAIGPGFAGIAAIAGGVSST